jgi:hypothetical protein
MAIVRLGDKRDRLAGLIDEALASYTAATPQWGLERRTLRLVLGDSGAARRRFPQWAWAIPALLAGFGAGVMLGRPVRSAFTAALNLSILGDWCIQLQATWFSTSIRESLLLFPYLDGTHLLGLAIMLGPSMMLDLRLIGVLWKRDPVSKVASRFLPITLAGFVLVISAGLLLFISEPVKCYESGYFRIKMGLIVLAAINAFVFHTTIDRRRSEWDTLLPPPAQARLAGILGLLLWTGVIFAGRYMAYNFSK